MKVSRKIAVGLAAGMLVGAVAMAGEHAGGSNKLKVVTVADAPDPFSPPVAGEVEIRAAFEARPTDAGAGAKANTKRFSVRVSVEIASEAGEIVRTLSEESAFSFPEHLPANQYHTVQSSTGWDGRNEAAEPVPDGDYTYAVRGALLREDVLGNGKTQVHLVGRSGILTGTVLVDSTPPEKPTLPPGEEEVVWVLPGQEQVTLLVQVASDVVDVEVEAEEPLVVVSVTMDGTLVEIVVDVTGLASPVEAKVTVWPVDDAGNKGEPQVRTVRKGFPVWHVDCDAAASGNGTSWAQAFKTIQEAVGPTGAASAGHEVWVAEGTYTRQGADTVVLTMQDGVEIYGGFAGTEVLRNERDPAAHLTTLDGEDITYHVVVGASDAILDGFTVTRGNACGSERDRFGGGMYNFEAWYLTVVNCEFSSNFGAAGGGMWNELCNFFSMANCSFNLNTGGGMANARTSGPITNCTFRENSNSFGGGMQNNQFSLLTIDKCTFIGNSANYGGGMVNGLMATSTVTNCVFLGNSANYGGGMYNSQYSHADLRNCIFRGNSATRGGGMYSFNGGVAVTNCTLSGNSATYGGGLYNVYYAQPDVVNTILWGNTASDGPEIWSDNTSSPRVAYSDVGQAGYEGTDGNINADPLFVDADGADGIAGTLDDDLSIQAGSPCIDAADGDVAPSMDILGDPRHDDTGITDTGVGATSGITWADMGAYEFQGTSPPSIAVTSPNGGEIWIEGEAHDIWWTSQGPVGSVDLHYSTDAGTNWTPIAAGEANDGSYSWTVPRKDSTQCRVRVQEADGDPTDVSDADFTIEYVPAITVTSPNGGDEWVAGSTESITWTSEKVDSVRIEVSWDNGANWETIVDSVDAMAGSYDWRVTGPASPECLVRISDADYPAFLDESDATFTIGLALWAWGLNSSGQLGDGTADDRSLPVQVPDLGVMAIAAGMRHSLAVKPDGAVWAWGDNEYGQLGDGTSGPGNYQTSPVQVSGLTDVVAVAGGRQHSLALKADGTVWAWGSDVSGQLGDGTGQPSPVPVQVHRGDSVSADEFFHDVVAIDVGATGSLALKADGTVWGWGGNNRGQLGDGTTLDRLAPVQVHRGESESADEFLHDVVAIAAGSSHCLAVQADGTVLAWGWNEWGQLGIGSRGTDQPEPVVTLFGPASAVAATSTFSLVLAADGTVSGSGGNGSGQLGNGIRSLWELAPVYVVAETGGGGLMEISAIAVGLSHSVALKADGSVRAWGNGQGGQLGIGVAGWGVYRSIPVQVLDETGDNPLRRVSAIACDGWHTIAARE